MNYNDILSMPVYERRFFISLLVKDVQKRGEQIEENRAKSVVNGSKGKRTTRVSGDALKSKLQSGAIPLK